MRPRAEAMYRKNLDPRIALTTRCTKCKGVHVHLCLHAGLQASKVARFDCQGMLMRQLLLLRGAFNLLFGIYLLTAPDSASLGGYYGVIDGVLGLCLAVALFRSVSGQWLFFVTLLDAMVRLVFGGTILLNPNITTNLFTGAF